MCPDCNIRTVAELTAGAEACRKSLRWRIIFVSFMLLAGTCVGIAENSWSSFFFTAGFGGFFEMWPRIVEKVRPSGKPAFVMLSYLMIFCVSLVIGTFLAPILLFWAIAGFIKTGRDLVVFNESMVFLQQHYPNQAAAFAVSSAKVLPPKAEKAERRRCVGVYHGRWKYRGKPSTPNVSNNTLKYGNARVHVVTNRPSATAARPGLTMRR